MKEKPRKPEVIVRIATPQDRKKLKATFEDYNGRHTYAVAVSEGKIVGICEATMTSVSDGRKKAVIHWLGVEYNMRGKGIGFRLLGKMHSYILKKRKKSVIADSLLSAEGFYEKAGYNTNRWPLELNLRRLKPSKRIRK